MFRSAMFIMLFVQAAAVYAASHCTASEVDYFSCKVKGSSKVVSLCGSELYDPDSATRRAGAWLQYRFGYLGRPELVYPSEKPDSLRAFTGEHVAPYSESVDTVWFKRGAATYGVEVRDAKNKFYGVWVSIDNKSTELPCDGQPDKWSTPEGNKFFGLVIELEETR
jgi:hypothetical protein